MPTTPQQTLNDVCSRARGILSEVPAAERSDAARVLELAETTAPTGGARRELVGLIERLGRRSGVAVPFASIARAVSALCAGDEPIALEALALADEALMFRGY